MTFILEPVQIQTGSADEEGRLVFADGWLVAVLVRLSAQHGSLAGHWYYEHGFGPFNGPTHPIFATLEAAQDWMHQRQGRQSRPTPDAPPPIGEP